MHKYSFLLPLSILVGVSMIVKSLTNKVTKDGGASDVLDVDVSGSTLTQHQAKSIADRLYQIMGATYKGKGKQIIAILKDLSNHDYDHVYKIFDLRQYSNYWNNIGDPFFSDDYDLTYWIRAEITDDDVLELDRLNPDLKIF